MNEFLQEEYYNNTVLEYCIALGIILVGFVVVRIIKRVILIRLIKFSNRTKGNFDNYVFRSIERFGIPALYIIVVYGGMSFLSLSDKVQDILDVALTVAITFLIIRLVSTAIQSLLEMYVRKKSEDHSEERITQLSGLMMIINAVIWIIGLVFLFDNMGYNVTAVIAGLGVGGIAIALAAQNILGDLFNYFVIFFDKPFEIGDFIIIDDKLGSVEYIGIKTTRLASLSGEQLIFSNSDLTESRIHNYKKMEKRRVVFTIRAPLDTPLDKVKKIPELLKSAVEAQDRVVFDRAHFAAYGEFSLNFEVVYYVLSSDYNVYMDVQQQINYQIYEALEALKVPFAYPARKVWFDNDLKVDNNGEEVRSN